MRNVVPNLELPQENTTGNINYLLLIDKLICRKKKKDLEIELLLYSTILPNILLKTLLLVF